MYKILQLLNFSYLFTGIFKVFGIASVYAFGYWFMYRHAPELNRNSGTVSRDEIDVWQNFEHKVPNVVYGAGCKKDFSHYLKYGSNVTVNSLEDICNWLLSCSYVEDRVQFFTRDHWQHPQEFEITQKGDCEDYALWAWNKLIKLGYKTEFVVGIIRNAERHGAHAWIVFESQQGERKLLECVATSRSKMIRPIPTGADEYVPFASVDEKLTRRAYMGLLFWKERIRKSLN